MSASIASTPARAVSHVSTSGRGRRPVRASSASSGDEGRPGLNLLGKTVKPEHILAGRGDDAVAKLALEAIAEERGVDVDALANDLARLETVVPGLKSRRLRGELKAGLVVSLALDISAATANVLRLKRELRGNIDVAEVCAKEPRLLQLGEEDFAELAERLEKARSALGASCDADALFATLPACLVPEHADGLSSDVLVQRSLELLEMIPDADIVAIAASRKQVLLNEDAHASAKLAISALRQRMPSECKIDRMLTDFPSLLLVDIDALFHDMRNTFQQDPADLLRRDPSISHRVRLSSLLRVFVFVAHSTARMTRRDPFEAFVFIRETLTQSLHLSP